MYGALASVEDRTKQDALKLFKQAIDNVKPAVEVKSRRVGGVDLPGAGGSAAGSADLAGHALAHRWPRATGPSGAWTRSWPAELMDAANNRGSAVKKREDTHKMAEANKAFAHYRW